MSGFTQSDFFLRRSTLVTPAMGSPIKLCLVNIGLMCLFAGSVTLTVGGCLIFLGILT